MAFTQLPRGIALLNKRLEASFHQGDRSLGQKFSIY